MLTASDNEYCLVVNGTGVVGIDYKKQVPHALTVKFSNGRCVLWAGETPLCYLVNGHFHAFEANSITSSVANSRLWEKLSQESRQDVFLFLDQIINSTRNNKFGCTIVIDFEDEKLKLNGIHLSTKYKIFDINPSLMVNLCKIDGALHLVTKDMAIHSFGCLLDGDGAENENLSRGARYNSALRYSKKYENVIVMTISEDGPITFFENGKSSAQIRSTIEDGNIMAPIPFSIWVSQN